MTYIASRVVLLAALGLALRVACTTTSSAGTGGSATGSSVVGAGGAASEAACGTCLASKCAHEKAEVLRRLLRLQGCIDGVCANLSVIGAPDEGSCQLYCQGLYPNGVNGLLAFVNCAASEPVIADAGPTCMPPCLGAPLDFDACATNRINVACKTQAAACGASTDCVAYEACAKSCTSLDTCQACSQTPSGVSGRDTYETLQVCIAHGCLAQEWLPHY